MYRVALLSCVFVLCLLLGSGSGCGGGKSGGAELIAGDSPQLTQPGGAPGELMRSGELTLGEVLAEVEASAAPSGVEEGLWRELTAELVRILGARRISKVGTSPPLGEWNRVLDLHLEEGGTTGYQLEWTYRNVGDYDLNTEVNISDLTPIGLHFGETEGGGNWSEAWAADGDGNGEVNIADVTPIGQNFMSKVQDYWVIGADSPDGPWVDVGMVPVDVHNPISFFYTFELAAIDFTLYRVVPLDDVGAEGIPSVDVITRGPVEVGGSVIWDTGGPVPGATVGVRTEQQVTEITVSTDQDGDFMVGLDVPLLPTVLVIHASYADMTTGLVLQNYRRTDVITEPGPYPDVVVELVDPAGKELTINGSSASNADGSVQIDGLPPEVQHVFAQAYDADVRPDLFPGELADSAGFDLNSTGFLWITGTDAASQEISQLSADADVGFELSAAQFGDISDVFPGNGQIDVPLYDMNEDTASWDYAGYGILVDESNNVLSESVEASIQDGSYSGRVFARSDVDHFSFLNVDYPYFWIWDTSAIPDKYRDDDLENALFLAMQIAMGPAGMSAFQKHNRPGSTGHLPGEYTIGGAPSDKMQAPKIYVEDLKGSYYGGKYDVTTDYWQGRPIYIDSKLWDIQGTQYEHNAKRLMLTQSILRGTAQQKAYIKGGLKTKKAAEHGGELVRDLFGYHYYYDTGGLFRINTGMPEQEDEWIPSPGDILDSLEHSASKHSQTVRDPAAVGDTGLVVEIAMDKSEYNLVEPMEVDITLRNDGSDSLDVMPILDQRFYPVGFWIHDQAAPADEYVAWQGPEPCLEVPPDSFTTLDPGQTATGAFDLRYDENDKPAHYDLFAAGTYTIQAAYSKIYEPADPVESAALTVTITAGQPGSIRGTVTDAATSSPFPNAKVVAVYNSQTWAEDTTDVLGEYELTGLSASTYEVRAHAYPGLRSSAANAVVTAGATTSGIDLQLTEPGWLMFGHDQYHSGRSFYAGPTTASVKWSYFYTDGEGTYIGHYAQPLVTAGGNVIVPTYGGELVSVSSAGSKAWGNDFAGYNTDADYSTAAAGPDGSIYIGQYPVSLFAVESAGAFKWRYESAYGHGFSYSKPIVGPDGTIYLASDYWEPMLYALQPNAGVKWTVHLQDYTLTSPALADDGTVYVGSQDDYLYAVKNGSIQWQYQMQGDVGTPVIAPDGTIYVYSESPDASLYAINPDGTYKWHIQPGIVSSYPGHVRPAIGTDGTLYIGSGFGGTPGFSALDKTNGATKWTYPLPDSDYDPSPAAVDKDGRIYFAGSYSFYALDASGSQVWKVANPDTYVCVAGPSIGPGQRVYFLTEASYLYAVGP